MHVDRAARARQAHAFAAAPGWAATYRPDRHAPVEDIGTAIVFGRVGGHRPSLWPDGAGAERLHLDLRMGDLDEATERRHAVGTGPPDRRPGAGPWRALLDPEGRPFSLRPRPGAPL